MDGKTEKVETICMAYRGTYKWNSENLKNVPEPWDIQDSGTFSNFKKFQLKVPLKSMKTATVFAA